MAQPREVSKRHSSCYDGASTQQLRLQGDHVSVPEPFIRQMFPKDYIKRGVICLQCTGCLLIELSRRYRVYGDDTRALSMALKAATIFNHVFGEDDEFSLCSRHEEAVVLRALKDHHPSELVFREILATRTTMLTCRQLELDSMYGLAENLDHLREHVEAESLYSQALELSKDKYGEVSNMTLGLMRGLSRNPSLQGRYEESTNISLEVVRLRNERQK